MYTRVYLDPMVLELEAMGCAALIIRHSKFIQIIDYVGLLDSYVLFIQSAKCLDIVLTISLSWIILCHISHNFFKLDYLMPHCVLSRNVMSVVSSRAVSCRVMSSYVVSCCFMSHYLCYLLRYVYRTMYHSYA